jgi:dolichol kinase
MLVFYIPLAIAGSSLLGLKGIFLAGSIANFAAGLLSLYFIYRYIVCTRENE